MPMIKISELNFDSKYQFMPDLPDDEFQALKEDIREWGIQNPPEIDENYRPLDGWNRIKVCQKLGISEIPVVIRDTGLSEEMKIEHAIVLNMDRRQITKSQKEDVVSKVIDMFPNYSFSRLAKITGLSDKTVKKIADRWAVSDNSETAQHEGLDGKLYPSNEIEVEKQRKEICETIKEHPDWSNRKVAKEVGVSHHTVGNQREYIKITSKDDNNDAPFDEDELVSEFENDKNEKFIPEPVRMETEAEGLKRVLCDEASRLDSILEDAFMNYQNDYAEEARLGFLELSKVIVKYKDIVG